MDEGRELQLLKDAPPSQKNTGSEGQGAIHEPKKRGPQRSSSRWTWFKRFLYGLIAIAILIVALSFVAAALAEVTLISAIGLVSLAFGIAGVSLTLAGLGLYGVSTIFNKFNERNNITNPFAKFGIGLILFAVMVAGAIAAVYIAPLIFGAVFTFSLAGLATIAGYGAAVLIGAFGPMFLTATVIHFYRGNADNAPNAAYAPVPRPSTNPEHSQQDASDAQQQQHALSASNATGAYDVAPAPAPAPAPAYDVTAASTPTTASAYPQDKSHRPEEGRSGIDVPAATFPPVRSGAKRPSPQQLPPSSSTFETSRDKDDAHHEDPEHDRSDSSRRCSIM